VIDYITDVKPLEDQGLNDSEIAYALSSRTAAPIPCAETKVVLEGSGAVVEDPVTQQRSGTLIAHYETLDGDDKSLLAWFISHVMIRGVEISSNEYPRSIQLESIVDGLPSSLESVAQDIIALGGGQPDAGTTTADVDASRTAYEAAQAEQARRDSIISLQAEIENTWINSAISDGTSSEAEVRAAIKAGL
jgi:hypothetical protein